MPCILVVVFVFICVCVLGLSKGVNVKSGLAGLMKYGFLFYIFELILYFTSQERFLLSTLLSVGDRGRGYFKSFFGGDSQLGHLILNPYTASSSEFCCINVFRILLIEVD